MITDELIQFVKSARAGGLSDEIIQERLKVSGWSETDIQGVLGELNPPAPAPADNFPLNPPQKTEHNTGMAVIAYLGILVVIPLFTVKDDAFVKFHVKQGLVLLIIEILLFFLLSILPLLGFLLIPLISLAVAILSIIGIINAANGKMKELPLVGSWARKLNF